MARASPSGPAREAAREAALGISWSCAGGLHSVLRLLLRKGPEAIWSASHRRLVEWGVSPSVAGRFEAKRREFTVDDAETVLSARDLLFVPFGSPQYPRELIQLEHPPAGLFARGTDQALSWLLNVPRVTIVGTRKATAYGAWAAEAFAAAFASNGVAVVSGMALGIDGRAHRAVLGAGGLTIAILGCGADIVYPRSHGSLYQRILEQGVILSELPPGTPPDRWTFPRRNRLLAALGDAVLVIEGSRVSGAMQTANWSLELGRPVFAVPGPISVESHRGCNQLLYEGAGPAVDPCVAVEDFFLETRIHTKESGRDGRVAGGMSSTPDRAGLRVGGASESPHGESILAALDGGPFSVDGLMEATGLSARQVNVALAQLEIMGKIVRAGPGQFIRAP